MNRGGLPIRVRHYCEAPNGWTSAAGVALGAAALWAYSRVEWPWVLLGWVALVPWLLVWTHCVSARTVLVTAFASTALFVALVFDWFARAVADYTHAHLVLARAIIYAASPLLEPQWFALAFVARWLVRTLPPAQKRTPPIEAVCAATVYVAVDYFAPTRILPDTLGLGLLAAPLWAQSADIGGVHFATFLLIASNVLVARAVHGYRQRYRWEVVALPLGLLGGVLCATWIYGAWRTASFDRIAGPAPRVLVGVIQGNVSHYDQLRKQLGTFHAVRFILDRYRSLSRSVVDRIDLLVWPETVYPTTFGTPKSPEGANFDREIAAFVQTQGKPLVFGAYDRDSTGEYNAAFVLVPRHQGLHTEVYRKRYPFPWTEHVPHWAESDWLRRLFPWLGTWRPGVATRVVTLPTSMGQPVRIAPLICYDALLREPARDAGAQGADLLVTLSNDSWFSEAGQRLSLLAAAFRSIETRRPQVRVTPTGLSATVDALGRPRVVTSPATAAAAVAEVQLVTVGLPPAARWGYWFPLACAIIAPALLFCTARPRFRLGAR